MEKNRPVRKNRYRKKARRKLPTIGRHIRGSLRLLFGLSLVAVMSCALIFVHDCITQSDYFRAQRVRIEGPRRLTQQQIMQHAGIEPQANILAINLNLARKRLLNHSWIGEAEVRRELPNRLQIKITEHEPLAILDLGTRFLLNTHGEIFKRLESSDPQDLPIVSGLEFADLNVPGTPRSATFDAVLEVLRLSHKSDNVRVGRLIRQIHVDRDLGLTLFASQGVKNIRLGYNHFQQKYDVLKELLTVIGSEKAFCQFEAIDLKDLDRIVVRPSEESLPTEHHKEA